MLFRSRAKAQVEVVLAPPELRVETGATPQAAQASTQHNLNDPSVSDAGWGWRSGASSWDPSGSDGSAGSDAAHGSFRDRLNAIDMR